jgi:hypothetical protein
VLEELWDPTTVEDVDIPTLVELELAIDAEAEELDVELPLTSLPPYRFEFML